LVLESINGAEFYEFLKEFNEFISKVIKDL